MALLARSIVTGALLCLGMSTAVGAQEMDVPVAVQLPLLLKVMSFDRHLRARAAGTLVIAIAYQSGYRASADAKDEAWRLASNTRQIDGMPVSVIAIDLDREELPAALARGQVVLLYVAPVRGIDIKDLVQVARAARVRTITGVVRYVESGLSVGVRLRGNRPRIVVNLASSRLEGAELAAELLKLAEVL
jgi:hypothetical protein